jgi:hypothetical protein
VSAWCCAANSRANYGVLITLVSYVFQRSLLSAAATVWHCVDVVWKHVHVAVWLCSSRVSCLCCMLRAAASCALHSVFGCLLCNLKPVCAWQAVVGVVILMRTPFTLQQWLWTAVQGSAELVWGVARVDSTTGVGMIELSNSRHSVLLLLLLSSNCQPLHYCPFWRLPTLSLLSFALLYCSCCCKSSWLLCRSCSRQL